MAESEPVYVDVNFRLHTENVEQKKKDLASPVEVPVVPQGAGASARTRGTPPAPVSNTGPQAQSFQNAIDAAQASGDTATARALATQASAMRVPVSVPNTPPAPTRPMPGGFGPGIPNAANVMYSRPIGPGLPFDYMPPLPPGAVAGGQGLMMPPGARQRANQNILNTRLFGSGMYMNLLFGGWEMAQAMNAGATAERFAAANPSDLTGQMKAWNTALDRLSSGILGSVVSMPFQSRREAIDVTAARATQANTLIEAREDYRRYRLGLSQQAYVGDVVGPQRMRREADVAYEQSLLKSKDQYDKIAEQERIARTQHEASLAKDREDRIFKAQVAMGYPGSVEGQNRNRLIAEQQIDAADKQLIDTERHASEQRLQVQRNEAERNAQRLRDQGYRDARMNRAGQAVAAEAALLSAQGRDYEARQATLHAAVVSGQMTKDAETINLEALRVGTLRESQLQAAAIRARIRPMDFEGQYNAAVNALPLNQPGRDDLVRSMREATDAEIRRRQMAANTANIAARFQLSGQPFMADVAGIVGARALAIDQGMPTGLANQTAINDTLLAFQNRAQQADLINISQQGRRAQIAALLNRDPMGAVVAGITENARSEEARLRQAGFPSQADAARQLGQSQLDLQKQEYLDSFRPSVVSNDYARAAISGLLRKDSMEDPREVLRTIDNARQNLQVPGTGGGDIPTLLGQLITIAEQFKTDFLAKLRN